jgi:hypothetical protein
VGERVPARFAPGAREVLVAAVAEARLRGDRRIGTDHLLLGVLRHPATRAAGALGVTLADARAALCALDEEALASLGLTLRLTPPGGEEQQRARCPAHPPGRLFGAEREPPTPEQVARLRAALSSGARAVLAEAIGDGDRAVTPERVLGALLGREPPDPVADLFARLGVDRAAARTGLAAPGADLPAPRQTL